MNEQLLFVRDAVVEEIKCRRSVRNQRDRVAEQQLGTNRPPKEAEVRGVPQVRVNPMGHEAVLLSLTLLYLMREVRACRGHAYGSRAKTDDARDDSHRGDPSPLLPPGKEKPVDGEQLQPILATGEGDHQLVRGGVIEQEVVERERVRSERGGQQVLQQVEEHEESEVDCKWCSTWQKQQKDGHEHERGAQEEGGERGPATSVRVRELGPRYGGAVL
eukprot:CAMPEP_0113254078 /NCGR_PEP_ID=MMETSP0008_2-20120614/13516_1 /TAXON_ID=97485 /ORGANISM="Prymnesium parvum" /LENGTH=216 /DNA_ID=CAMNT_0000102285 /DNA_START=393 /DNA_END=1040 /DNA_ORIENTATION=- /assembly_acc=CAM_ASM_000153